jgi:hypothetical protein
VSDQAEDADETVGLSDPTQPDAGAQDENQDQGQAEDTSPPKKFWNRQRVDKRTYDGVYQDWKVGGQSAKALGRKWGISDDSICRFIKVGVPSKDWPSYRTRLTLEKDSIKRAGERAADQIATEIIGEAREVRQRNLNIAKAGSAVLAGMVGRMIEQIKSTPLTRSAPRVTHVVRADGTKETIREIVQRPLDMYEAGQVMQRISGSLSQLSRVEVASLGIKDPEDPTFDIPESEKLTQEEVDYINTHDGQLPEGMTMEQFIQRGGLAYGLQFSKVGQG